jgi:DNA primase
MKKAVEIQKLAEQYNSNIPNDIKEWLTTARGLSEEIIASFKIGWNGKAVTIPIYDRSGQYQFFKFRKSPNDTSDFSKYWYSPDSFAELYGWEHITNPKQRLIICEGEFDRLILESNSILAITATSGAGTFNEEWIDEINNLPSEIFLCYDNDKAGMDGVEKIARAIPQAHIIRIPTEGGIKDITDFITKKGIENFKKLIDEAQTLQEIEEESRVALFSINRTIFPETTLQDIVDVLSITIKEDNINKPTSFLCCLSAYTDD